MSDEQTQLDRLYRDSTDAHLVAEGFLVTNLRASLIGVLFDQVSIKLRSKDPISKRFTNGDMVSIQRSKNAEEVFQGTIDMRSSHDIQIVMNDTLPDLENGLWRITLRSCDVPFQRMCAALDIATANNNEFDGSRWAQLTAIKPTYLPGVGKQQSTLRKILIEATSNAEQLASQPSKLTPLHKHQDVRYLMKHWVLNESQRETILKCLERTLSLIQGPPGTGKTHTAIHLLRILAHLYTGTHIPIMAAAFTNVATDNLLEGLIDHGIKALRIGSPSKVRPEIRTATLQHQLLKHPEHAKWVKLNEAYEEKKQKMAGAKDQSLYQLLDHLKQQERKMIRDVIDGAQVICCTCVGAGDPLLAEQYFPIVILDESTQAIEPATLIPLTKGAQHVVMLGDHFQLPPTVMSERAKAGGLGESLFERLVREGNIKPFVLDTQYRMHPQISEFPSRVFYKGAIKDGVTAAERPRVRGFQWSLLPVAFINLNGPESSSKGKSRSNLGEVDYVLRLVREFVKQGIRKSQIGIISPYAEQVALLTSKIEADVLLSSRMQAEEEEGENAKTQIKGGLNVASVDGFQGREKDIIIISAVRANEHGNVGFLSDWRRLNVALTRARFGVIVVGNKATLCSDPYWKKWLDWVEVNGGIIEEDPVRPPKTKPVSQAKKGKPKLQPRPKQISSNEDSEETVSNDEMDDSMVERIRKNSHEKAKKNNHSVNNTKWKSNSSSSIL